MYVWTILILGSVFCGFVAASFKRLKSPEVIAGVVPAVTLVAAIVVTEYTTPYSGGGASLWPIAAIIGGGSAALFGVLSCRFFKSTLFKS